MIENFVNQRLHFSIERCFSVGFIQQVSMLLSPIKTVVYFYLIDSFPAVEVTNRDRHPSRSVFAFHLHAIKETTRHLHIVVVYEDIGKPSLFEESDPRKIHGLGDHDTHRALVLLCATSAGGVIYLLYHVSTSASRSAT